MSKRVGLCLSVIFMIIITYITKTFKIFQIPYFIPLIFFITIFALLSFLAQITAIFVIASISKTL